LFRSSGFHNLLDFDNQKSMGNWVVKNLSDLGCDQKPSDRRCQKTVGSAGLKIRRIGGGKKPSDRGCADLNTERSEEKIFFLRIPFEINKQKKQQKNGSEEKSHGLWAYKLGRRDLEKKKFLRISE
jgi:hypothetical protein